MEIENKSIGMCGHKFSSVALTKYIDQSYRFVVYEYVINIPL